MSNLLGLEYLKSLLDAKRTRCELRYSYYELKNRIPPILKNSPYGKQNLECVVGWAQKSVDCLADRLVVKRFKNDDFDIEPIFDMNSRDILFPSAIASALITSCSFIWISKDAETEDIRMEVIDGRNATGIVDPVTGFLKEGYAVLDVDPKTKKPILEAYFTPTETVFHRKGEEPYSVQNPARWPLLVPVIFRPDAKRPMGHSRISRAQMRLIESAVRTLFRSEVAGEFYSFPQKYVLGTSADSEPMEKAKATVSTLIEISKDEDGDHPVMGQFTTQPMGPFLDQFRTFASSFAGETGLTLNDLGFQSDVPASADAIKSAHEELRNIGKSAQKTFSVAFINAGLLGASLRDNQSYKRSEIYRTKIVWEPMFEPDASMISGFGDGANKINQVVPGFFDKANIEDLTGIQAGE